MKANADPTFVTVLHAEAARHVLTVKQPVIGHIRQALYKNISKHFTTGRLGYS